MPCSSTPARTRFSTYSRERLSSTDAAILTEYREAPEVTRTRMYLEALNEVLPKVGSVVVTQDGQMSPVPLFNLRDAQPRAAGGAQ